MKKLVKKVIILVFGIKRFHKLKRKFKTDELDIIGDYLINKVDSGTMIDVGVHFGESSLMFLEKNWKVYGFEPDQKNREQIIDYVKNHKNFILEDIAISDKSGQMMFYTSDESSGISSLLSFHDSHKADKIVQVKTLNEVISEKGVSNIDFLKIDTEGHDLMVLQGIDFEKHPKLKLVLCEYEDKKTEKVGYKTIDTIKYLQKNGFNVIVSEWQPIVKYGTSHKFKEAKKFPCEISNESWGNLIAYKVDNFDDFFLSRMNRR